MTRGQRGGDRGRKVRGVTDQGARGEGAGGGAGEVPWNEQAWTSSCLGAGPALSRKVGMGGGGCREGQASLPAWLVREGVPGRLRAPKRRRPCRRAMHTGLSLNLSTIDTWDFGQMQLSQQQQQQGAEGGASSGSGSNGLPDAP